MTIPQFRHNNDRDIRPSTRRSCLSVIAALWRVGPGPNFLEQSHQESNWIAGGRRKPS